MWYQSLCPIPKTFFSSSFKLTSFSEIIRASQTQHRWIEQWEAIFWYCKGKHTDWNRPPWPGTTVTICMSCFTTGGPGKEQGTNKPPPTRRARERSKGDTTCPTTSQNPSLWHQFWLNKACTTRKDSESEWLAKDNPETNPITIKPETARHVAELFSWVPLPSCSPLGCPFPIKFLALSADVSPRTIHFRVLDKSPVLGPERDPFPATVPQQAYEAY